MMLMLKDRGWVVLTNSWSAVTGGDDAVAIYYTGGDKREAVGLTMSMAAFEFELSRSAKLCDVREWCQ